MKRLVLAVLLFLGALGVARGQNAYPPTNWFPTAVPINTTIVGPLTINGSDFVDQNGNIAYLFGLNLDNYVVSGLTAYDTIHHCRIINSQPTQAVGGYTPLQGLQVHLDNAVAAGFNAVRIHGLDLGGTMWPINLAAAVTTTRSFDPVMVQALGMVFNECEQRNLKIVLELHYWRQVVPADDPALPGGTTPEFQELINPNAQLPKTVQPNNCLTPWNFFFPSVLGLQEQYDSNLLTTINPVTGAAFGKSPSLVIVQLENEQSMVKGLVVPAGATLLQAAVTASQQAFAPLIGVTWVNAYSLNKVNLQRWAAWQESNALAKRMAYVQTLVGPNVYVSTNTYFGNAQWPALISCGLGQVTDFHFYSRELGPAEPNGFTTIVAGSAVPRFEQVCAGCSLINHPVIVTEWGPVNQAASPLVRDAPAEESLTLANVITAAKNKRLAGLFIYSWGHHPFVMPDTSNYRKEDVYDFSDDNILFGPSAQQQIAQFFKSRSYTPPACITPVTYGVGTGPQYALYGPYTDPLVNVKGWVQIQLTPPLQLAP